MNINDILKNETVKNLLSKTGVSEKQANDIINQALSLLGDNFKQQPKQMSSLLSVNPNTDDDNNLAKKIENEFKNKLTGKIGLSSDKANVVQGAMPHIIQTVSKNMSEKGSNHQQGFESLFQSFGSFISKKENQNMLINTAKSIFSSFFKRK